MKKNIIFGVFILLLVGIVSCVKNDDTSKCGVVVGRVKPLWGTGAFKVVLNKSGDEEEKHIVITSDNGNFIFRDIEQGSYVIDVVEDDFEMYEMFVNDSQIYNGHFEINGDLLYNSKSIEVVANQTVNVDILMYPTSTPNPNANEELTILDIQGNPIGGRITIEKYTPMISIKLFNETPEDIWWNIYSYCQVMGDKDTVIGTYSTYVTHLVDLFSSLSPVEGALSPGQQVVIVGIIDEEIYEMHDLNVYYPQISLTYGVGQISCTRKSIGLDLPFAYEKH